MSVPMSAAGAVVEATSLGAGSKAPDYSPAQASAYAAARFPATYAVLYKVHRLAGLMRMAISPTMRICGSETFCTSLLCTGKPRFARAASRYASLRVGLCLSWRR